MLINYPFRCQITANFTLVSQSNSHIALFSERLLSPRKSHHRLCFSCSQERTNKPKTQYHNILSNTKSNTRSQRHSQKSESLLWSLP